MNEKRKPDFKANGVAVWESIDKNGHRYLSINIVGHSNIKAFENLTPTEETPSEDIHYDISTDNKNKFQRY